jgi:hypothetical protein
VTSLGFASLRAPLVRRFRVTSLGCASLRAPLARRLRP